MLLGTHEWQSVLQLQPNAVQCPQREGLHQTAAGVRVSVQTCVCMYVCVQTFANLQPSIEGEVLTKSSQS